MRSATDAGIRGRKTIIFKGARLRACGIRNGARESGVDPPDRRLLQPLRDLEHSETRFHEPHPRGNARVPLAPRQSDFLPARKRKPGRRVDGFRLATGTHP
jgi:hypothetical protein